MIFGCPICNSRFGKIHIEIENIKEVYYEEIYHSIDTVESNVGMWKEFIKCENLVDRIRSEINDNPSEDSHEIVREILYYYYCKQENAF